MSSENENNNVEGLISYRLGRLEKQIEESEKSNILRHDSLLFKLEGLGRLERVGAENRLRIEILEKSRDRLIGVTSILATGVTLTIVQMLFGVFSK